MDEFFEYLKIIGIGAPSDAPRVLLNHTSQEVFEIATRCYSLTERPSPVPGEGAFNFTVNSTISGGIYPCSDHNCRRYNAYNLASFAALYVDSIYIPNFFEYVYQFNKRGGSFSNESQAANFVSRVITDIILMLELKPLFLANILHIHPQSGEYCSTHLKEIRQHETNLYNQFAKIEKDIVSDLVKKVKFQIYTNTIVPLDPSDYLGGGMYTFVSVPKRLRRYIGDVPYTFTDTEATELGIIGQYINPIFDDLTAQKYSAPLRNLPYLTNKKIELDIINKMAGQTLDQKSSDSRVKELIHQLPFIQNVPLASLLDLRQEEEESFQCYRDAIRSAASLARESNDVDSLQSIKDNILSPAIYKIDAIIKNNRDTFVAQGFRDIAFASAALTAFLAASSHGLAGISGPAITTVITRGVSACDNYCKAFGEPISAKDNNYYYLWRVRQLHSENSLF